MSDVFYVDQNATCTGSACDGTTWCNAYKKLQDALAVDSGGTITHSIKVADGVYYPDEGGTTTADDRSESFVLQDGWSWEGGYAGCGATNADARDFIDSASALSGEIQQNSVDTDNSYHVVTVPGVATLSSGTAIDGFTIRKGYPKRSGTQTETSGGGMLVDGGSAATSHVTFSKNTAASGALGGGMAVINKGASQGQRTLNTCSTRTCVDKLLLRAVIWLSSPAPLLDA